MGGDGEVGGMGGVFWEDKVGIQLKNHGNTLCIFFQWKQILNGFGLLLHI